MRIYVAGAINANNVLTVMNNIKLGIHIGAEIIKLGHSPFVPHLDYQFQFFKDLKIEDYHRYSMDWLEVSDIVFILPESESSVGTKAEIKRAKELKIPVVYHDLTDLIMCIKGLEGETIH